MPLQALNTDTAAQKAVADSIGSTAQAEQATLTSFLSEVQALQGRLVGETGTATQAKAQHLHEVGIQLVNQLNSISERVGQSAGGYVNVDSDGAGTVQSSASLPF
ncbi:MAG: WXG100 family type VII secretion target [Actinobacteria bacterium]|nr:WXG100 family type VII secretion target [Actinomycetota bacterium]